MKFPQTMLDLNDPMFAANPDSLALAGELILRSVGEDIEREGLAKTPARFAKAMRELCSGYLMTAEDAVGEGLFPAEGSGLVSVRDVEFFSTCEHHMLPFWGKISVAYYPDKFILGLSKIPRIVDVFAKRLQVQERLTSEVCHSIYRLAGARAVGVKATGCHMCMMMRGVKKTHSETTTEFFLGLDTITPDERSRLMKSVD
jgi:GTP cyclohydrolase IA